MAHKRKYHRMPCDDWDTKLWDRWQRDQYYKTNLDFGKDKMSHLVDLSDSNDPSDGHADDSDDDVKQAKTAHGFDIGATVEAHSLKTQMLNGAKGVVRGPAGDRVKVSFPAPTGEKALKPENLKPADPEPVPGSHQPDATCERTSQEGVKQSRASAQRRSTVSSAAQLLSAEDITALEEDLCFFACLLRSAFTPKHHVCYNEVPNCGGTFFVPPPRGSVKLSLRTSYGVDLHDGWHTAYYTPASIGVLDKLVTRGLGNRADVCVTPDPNQAAADCKWTFSLTKTAPLHLQGVQFKVVLQCRVRPESFVNTVSSMWIVRRPQDVWPCAVLLVQSLSQDSRSSDDSKHSQPSKPSIVLKPKAGTRESATPVENGSSSPCSKGPLRLRSRSRGKQTSPADTPRSTCKVTLKPRTLSSASAGSGKDCTSNNARPARKVDAEGAHSEHASVEGGEPDVSETVCDDRVKRLLELHLDL